STQKSSSLDLRLSTAYCVATPKFTFTNPTFPTTGSITSAPHSLPPRLAWPVGGARTNTTSTPTLLSPTSSPSA
ncbi:unnamed protein product, partial [Closterium sp. NIES-54]